MAMILLVIEVMLTTVRPTKEIMMLMVVTRLISISLWWFLMSRGMIVASRCV